MNHLKEIRNQVGMSKWRLARESNLNWKTIHRIERGEHLPFDSSKEKIASVLGVTVEELFPSKDVMHILIIEPRPIIKKKATKSKRADLIGFLLDKNIKRCGNIQVKLMSGRKKIMDTKSEADGRFVFKNVSKGKYQLAARYLSLDIEI